MTFAFVRVDRANRVTGRVIATDAQAARVLLPCGEGSYVTSEASHAIGVPRAVKAALAKAPKSPSEQQAEARRATVAKAQRTYKARHREATPLAPAVVREGRAQLARQMEAVTAKLGRPPKRAVGQRGPDRRGRKSARKHAAHRAKLAASARAWWAKKRQGES